MRLIGVSQRTTFIEDRGEKRDSLDQRLVAFLLACGVLPVPIPNSRDAAEKLWSRILFEGLVLSGGGDSVKYGGMDPERDETELFLLRRAITSAIPVLGICRGMQLMQDFFHVPLEKISGHVKERMVIIAEGVEKVVNSYHNLGTCVSVPELSVWALAEDGIIKAIRHTKHPLTGIMWHPERNNPFNAEDIALVKNIYEI